MYAVAVQLLQPFPLLLAALLTATVWAWRRGTLARRPAIVSLSLLGLLWLCSTGLARDIAYWSLERRYPPADVAINSSDTIIVLSGSIMVDKSHPVRAWVGPDTVVRCFRARELYQQAGRCRIIVSGGKVNPATPGPTLAAAMRDFLAELGVDPADVLLEERSTNTYENALYSKDLLPQPPVGTVFLVTHPDHMLRAILCFQAQQLAVVPAPSSLNARRLEFTPTDLLPSSEGLRGVERAAHEWLGIAWYWLRGRI